MHIFDMLENIENMWLLSAGVVAALTCVVHIFAGGHQVVKPSLSATDIPEVAKYTNYYSWHLVTFSIAAMAVGFVWGAIDPTQTGLIIMWTVMAALFTVWSFTVILWNRQKVFDMPQWTMFSATAILGIIGLTF